MRVAHRFVLVLCAAACAAFIVSCKSDKAAAATDAGAHGESCISPGQAETGCSCNGSRVGYRICRSDNLWGECTCPPGLSDGALCQQGQLLKCPTCPGAKDGRVTRCLQGGTYDCSCAQDAGQAELDAAQPAAHDAGSTAASDAGSSTADAQ